jgi:hypothetical protein
MIASRARDNTRLWYGLDREAILKDDIQHQRIHIHARPMHDKLWLNDPDAVSY